MKGGQASINEGLILLEQPLPEYLRDNNEEIIKFSSSISLHNLTFRYSENTQLVLDNINIIIDKGLKIGIIGSTGSGKSTLLDVVMGLLLPTGGNIKIDETIVTNKNYRSWQSKIAHVPQMIFLSDSTISENIAFGVPYNLIDFERVKKCAEMAKLDETISNWAQKYNTSVGERGVKLSGGQRQRIGIARALYKNSEIIIFDEATSALDNDTEKAVMNSIEELSSDLTIIIVAHRLTTLKLCDIIYELKNGKIHRSGSYNDIINN
jgi:ATP-binding cassette subfamily B protein